MPQLVQLVLVDRVAGVDRVLERLGVLVEVTRIGARLLGVLRAGILAVLDGHARTVRQKAAVGYRGRGIRWRSDRVRPLRPDKGNDFFAETSGPVALTIGRAPGA